MVTGSNIVKLDPESKEKNIFFKFDKKISLDNGEWFKAVHEAVECLKSGGVIAVPTDTLYGLCTLAENADRLYKLKRRPKGKPLGIFVNEGEDVFKYFFKKYFNFILA